MTAIITLAVLLPALALIICLWLLNVYVKNGERQAIQLSQLLCQKQRGKVVLKGIMQKILLPHEANFTIMLGDIHEQV